MSEPTSEQIDIEVRDLPKSVWLVWVVSGALSAMVGFWLLLSPRLAISTLALLVGLGLIVNGIAELAAARDHGSPVVSYVLGALFLVGGVMVFFRPGGRAAALLFLAIVVGVTMIITGIGELIIAFSARDEIEHWLILAFTGAVGIIAGVIAVAWPTITVLVLAILLGIRMLVIGLTQIGIGLRIRSLTA